MYSNYFQSKKPLLLLLLVITILSNLQLIVTSTPQKYVMKIAGGSRAKVNQFPFAVSILVNHTAICGGSLISDRWVLTAAHCLVDINQPEQTQKTILLNIKNISLSIGNITSNTIAPKLAKNIFIHPGYKDNDNLFDAGLIELEKPVNFSTNMQPVKLVQNSSIVENNQVYTAIGWGKTKTFDESPFLQRVNLPAGDKNICNKAFPSYSNHTDQLICIGSGNGRDTCVGDSGNPLLIETQDTSYCSVDKIDLPLWLQIGITSFGKNFFGRIGDVCGGRGAIGFYARCDFFIPWIAKTTQLKIDQFSRSFYVI